MKNPDDFQDVFSTLPLSADGRVFRIAAPITVSRSEFDRIQRWVDILFNIPETNCPDIGNPISETEEPKP